MSAEHIIYTALALLYAVTLLAMLSPVASPRRETGKQE